MRAIKSRASPKRFIESSKANDESRKLKACPALPMSWQRNKNAGPLQWHEPGCKESCSGSAPGLRLAGHAEGEASGDQPKMARDGSRINDRLLLSQADGIGNDQRESERTMFDRQPADAMKKRHHTDTRRTRHYN